MNSASPGQLDPQVQALLRQRAANRPPAPKSPLSPTEAIATERNGYRQTIPLAGKPEAIHKVENSSIPGTAGTIPIRIYTPRVAQDLPVLVYFHGGGFALGDLDTHDTPLRTLANRVDCIIVSVAYRLAPEHPFPAGIEDAYAATQWVSQNAKAIGGDTTRIAVAGDSAGGTIATVVTKMARDRRTLSIAYQVLIYPNTDTTLSSTSWQELGSRGYVLTTDRKKQSYERYIPQEVDPQHPYISPLQGDLSNLPPAFLITGEFDPLRDEGEAYAKRLQQAGVSVKAKRYNGMIHGFFQMGGVIDQGNQAISDVAMTLKEAFANPPKRKN